MAMLRCGKSAVLTVLASTSVAQKQRGVNCCLTQGRGTNLGSSLLG